MTSPGETALAPRRATRREWLGLGVLALACLLYVMDLTVLHLAVPAISADLRPTSVELLWIIDVYGFMVAGFLITMGTLGDRIGRRRLLLVGAAAFGAVSLLAAFSTSPTMLIASRALLGIAGATIAPSTLSLIFAMFEDPRQRATAIGVWVSAFSAGSAVGPVLGGLLLEHFWWGSVFLLAVPVMVALLLLGPRLLPEYRAPNAGRLDLIGAAMSLIAVLSLTLGLKLIAQDGIGPVAVASTAIGIVVGAIWVRRQLAASDPMFDLSLFRIPSFSASLVVNLLTVFVAIGYFLFVAQYLQLVLGLSPLIAGLWSLPEAAGFIVGSNLGPRLIRRIRPAHVIAGGLAIAGAGLVILSQVTASTGNGLAIVVIASLLVSLGLAPIFGLTTDLIVGSAPPERAGAASGMSETFFELGGSLGLAILGSLGIAIYRGQLTTLLPASIPAAAAAAARDTLGGARDVAAQLPTVQGEVLLAAARHAFVAGMQVAALVCVVVAVIVAVFAVRTLHHVPPSGDEIPEEAELAAPGLPCKRPDGHVPHRLGKPVAEA
jgi:DHA2 family multidrug resistance protein-like MFS transporter